MSSVEIDELIDDIARKMVELTVATIKHKYPQSSFVPNNPRELLEHSRTHHSESIFWGNTNNKYSPFYAVVGKYVVYGDVYALRTDDALGIPLFQDNGLPALRNIMSLIGISQLFN